MKTRNDFIKKYIVDSVILQATLWHPRELKEKKNSMENILFILCFL